MSDRASRKMILINILSLPLAAMTVAATTATPLPSPPASSLPVIGHTITSASCTTLHTVIMPIGFVVRKDDEAFGGMSDRLEQIFTDFANQGGAPTREQLMELGDSKAPGASNRADPSGPSTSVDPGDQETNLVYSPAQVVKASQVDSIANAVDGNLALASQVLDKSLSASPPGKDAKSDEMRAQARALIEAQRAFDAQYHAFVKQYLNNQNVAWAVNPDQRAFVNAYLVTLLNGTQATAKERASIGSNLSNSYRAQIAAIEETAETLRSDEQTFGAEVVSTYNQCNGTHIDLNASPSPKP